MLDDAAAKGTVAAVAASNSKDPLQDDQEGSGGSKRQRIPSKRLQDAHESMELQKSAKIAAAHRTSTSKVANIPADIPLGLTSAPARPRKTRRKTAAIEEEWELLRLLKYGKLPQTVVDQLMIDAGEVEAAEIEVDTTEPNPIMGVNERATLAVGGAARRRESTIDAYKAHVKKIEWFCKKGFENAECQKWYSTAIGGVLTRQPIDFSQSAGDVVASRLFRWFGAGCPGFYRENQVRRLAVSEVNLGLFASALQLVFEMQRIINPSYSATAATIREFPVVGAAFNKVLGEIMAKQGM